MEEGITMLSMFSLGEQPSEHWDEEKRKNAVGEEMPEYIPTPESISPCNSTDKHDDDKSVDIESDGEEEKKCDETERYLDIDCEYCSSICCKPSI